MSVKIAGSRVAVTGAGSGIGAATSLECARAGAAVIAIDIDGAAAEATAEACARLGAASAAYACDVGDYDAVVTLAGRIEAEQGPVDVLVNNAGVGVAGPFLEHSIEDWRWLRSVNIDGVVHGAHVFGRPMVQRGRGHVVNLASMAGYMPHGSLAAYCTSKAAVIMFSQCLRADWARQGVGVTAICPGVIDTPIPANTRMVGATADKRAQAIRAFGFGHSPSAVAKAIIGAVEHNRELVPVGIESSMAYRVLRFAPRMLRGAFARVQM
ncbi:MAG: 2-hydroxycyclohexanecarboxyl-CoA dehydrogenase [Solirubrobacteraceae bacterium]|jgi:NAD(P)-dependent dehydrogenase (short-subunit alcohol dehydrogenase family)|nr:2-hydroxycyclohexanecarboxyl-CoA dehydrogenase [Solirubrobacteraceae bacterium]